MAQLNIILNQEEIQSLLLNDCGDAFKKILEASLNKIMQVESAEQLKAAPYERSTERTDSRNGSRDRELNTRLGRITLHVPRHRNVPFKTLAFENYSRSEAGDHYIFPRLALAYRLKNAFLDVMRTPHSQEGSKLLCNWILFAESQLDYLPEFKKCTTTYHNWSQEILNALDVPWSNGYTEGCNNRTKVLNRVCLGVRNFNRFRNRILHCAS